MEEFFKKLVFQLRVKQEETIYLKIWGKDFQEREDLVQRPQDMNDPTLFEDPDKGKSGDGKEQAIEESKGQIR